MFKTINRLQVAIIIIVVLFILAIGLSFFIESSSNGGYGSVEVISSVHHVSAYTLTL